VQVVALEHKVMAVATLVVQEAVRTRLVLELQTLVAAVELEALM
jgi:hypothetical protein